MASAERGDWFEKQTLGSLPARAARRWGACEALCFKGRRLTFADLARGVAPCSDPRAARRPPSCRRREASFLLIRAGHLSIDGGGVHA